MRALDYVHSLRYFKTFTKDSHWHESGHILALRESRDFLLSKYNNLILIQKIVLLENLLVDIDKYVRHVTKRLLLYSLHRTILCNCQKLSYLERRIAIGIVSRGYCIVTPLL